MDPWNDYLKCEDPVDQVIQDAVIKLAVRQREAELRTQIEGLARVMLGG